MPGKPAAGEKIASYTDFWPFYLGEHRNPRTRHLHYFGTSLAIATVIAAVASQTWWLLAAAVFCGYFFAWIGHFFVERNRPATFTYPFFSLAGDFHMWALMWQGRMTAEVERLAAAKSDPPAP